MFYETGLNAELCCVMTKAWGSILADGAARLHRFAAPSAKKDSRITLRMRLDQAKPLRRIQSRDRPGNMDLRISPINLVLGIEFLPNEMVTILHSFLALLHRMRAKACVVRCSPRKTAVI